MVSAAAKRNQSILCESASKQIASPLKQRHHTYCCAVGIWDRRHDRNDIFSADHDGERIGPRESDLRLRAAGKTRKDRRRRIDRIARSVDTQRRRTKHL